MKKSNASVVDMISNLPDPILHLILSGLPMEEVIQTSILSRRWRYLWTSVPTIDVKNFRGLKPSEEFRKNKFKEFVSRVLASNSLDLDSFRLSCGLVYNLSTVGKWIDAALNRNVKVLDLMFGVGDDDEYKYDNIGFPHWLVTCRSLEVLKLTLLAYRLTLPKFTCFRALRVLELNSLELYDEDLIKEFFKSCTLLEDLRLIDCLTERLDYLCVSCPKLKNLRIDNWNREGFVEWEHYIYYVIRRIQICCPKLVCLEFARFMAKAFIFGNLDSLKKAVIHPEDNFQWGGNHVCELLAGLSHVEYLSLRICLIEQDINLEHLPKYLPNLKTLELTTKVGADIMDVMIRILKCSPNLESLHIIIEEGSSDSSSTVEAPDFDILDMECTFKELKMVKLMGISAVPHHMGFIEFLLENTPFLETMSITDGKLSFLSGVLKFPRASPEAKIIFF